ncbi:hypothetical protein [Nonomuraea lactucae]|uniref:hypothetical protein n=1 Tax=Nonomuraea lactucae TaxID=2249762 RepID=UPI000DE427D0|nr:hypothetical protein [Nonomuraea lactucae]
MGGAEAPTSDDRRLLSMLTAGVPDRTAAKHLGYSARTYQRRIQELMARLGAETRFQAGLQAALLGWIDRPATTATSRRPGRRTDTRSRETGTPVWL